MTARPRAVSGLPARRARRRIPEHGGIGAGPGNYPSGLHRERRAGRSALPAGGAPCRGNLARVRDAHLDAVAESVSHGWYADDSDPATWVYLANGHDGAPLLEAAGRRPLHLAAPRYDGQPMETSPAGPHRPRTGATRWTTLLGELLGVGPGGVSSVLGRMLARAVEHQARSARIWSSSPARDGRRLGRADITRESWPDGDGPFSRRGCAGPSRTRGHASWERYRFVVDATTWNSPPAGRARHARSAGDGARRHAARRSDLAVVLRVVHSFNPALLARSASTLDAGPVDIRVHAGEVLR